MTDIQLVLVLLAAYWAGTSAVFSGVKLVNEARDKILLGSDKHEQFSAKHKRQILLFDWLPMIGALVSISMVLGIVLLVLPTLRDQTLMGELFPTICKITSTVPWGGFLFFLIRGFSEFRLLNSSIKNEIG